MTEECAEFLWHVLCYRASFGEEIEEFSLPIEFLNKLHKY